MDDLTAIRRLKSGDIQGLGALVERYQVEAGRAAYLITHDSTLAQDVIQEAFLRVHANIRNFDDTRPFAPYFMRIVANVAIDMMKQPTAEPFDVDTFAAQFPDSLPTPENISERSELRRAVWDALGSLAPQQRAAVVLRYYFDYSEKEVAQALDQPQGTVSWRLSTARKQLGLSLRSFWSPKLSRNKGNV